MRMNGNQTQAPIQVLALDDNPADLCLLERLLGQWTSHPATFTGCQTPGEALEVLRTQTPDVLLVDYSLGSLSGIEFLERVRQSGPPPASILLTGGRDPETAAAAIKSGFLDYLSKGSLTADGLGRAMVHAIDKRELEREVERSRRQLEETVQELQRKNAEISSFYHTLAHELKTPLTGVREFVSIIGDGLVGEVNGRQAELLGAALHSCDRLAICIDDLFDVSRMETGKLELRPKPCSLQELVQAAVQGLASRASKAQVELVVETDSDLPDRPFDRVRMQQVLDNLIGNALKFTDAGGRVFVTSRPGPAGEQVLAVKDTGRGIAAEDLPRIFDRLYQSTGISAVVGGMGLGLHLAKELVQMHGGRLLVQSTVGVGTEFTAYFPDVDSPDLGTAA